MASDRPSTPLPNRARAHPTSTPHADGRKLRHQPASLLAIEQEIQQLQRQQGQQQRGQPAEYIDLTEDGAAAAGDSSDSLPTWVLSSEQQQQRAQRRQPQPNTPRQPGGGLGATSGSYRSQAAAVAGAGAAAPFVGRSRASATSGLRHNFRGPPAQDDQADRDYAAGVDGLRGQLSRVDKTADVLRLIAHYTQSPDLVPPRERSQLYQEALFTYNKQPDSDSIRWQVCADAQGSGCVSGAGNSREGVRCWACKKLIFGGKPAAPFLLLLMLANMPLPRAPRHGSAPAPASNSHYLPYRHVRLELQRTSEQDTGGLYGPSPSPASGSAGGSSGGSSSSSSSSSALRTTLAVCCTPKCCNTLAAACNSQRQQPEWATRYLTVPGVGPDGTNVAGCRGVPARCVLINNLLPKIQGRLQQLIADGDGQKASALVSHMRAINSLVAAWGEEEDLEAAGLQLPLLAVPDGFDGGGLESEENEE